MINFCMDPGFEHWTSMDPDLNYVHMNLGFEQYRPGLGPWHGSGFEHWTRLNLEFET